MSAQTPEQIHELFASSLNAGNAEAASLLFEDDAILVSDPENIVRGRTAIRDGLVNFLSVKPQLTLNAARVVRNGDVALLYSDWTIAGTKGDGSGFSMDVRPTHLARRQPDGTWRIVIDDPSADGA
jgi:uncharacterized protein (TIGR02246 family)